ncbi:MAG: monothiol bacilliredoxin BrxC family protein [Dehalococcoidia bacterium]
MSQRTRFHEITDLASLQQLMVADVTVFLHDPWCPISASAFEEMEAVGGDVHLIDVSQQHELKREFERATRVRHESPQVIVLRGGAPVWHASHGRIRTAKVREAAGASTPT